MVATATDYDKITVEWVNASGTYTAARLVRSQVGFSETAEDGIILWEQFCTNNTLPLKKFVDGVDNFNDSLATNLAYGKNNIALANGGYVFYTMWLKGSDGLWALAGETYTLLPKSHSTKTSKGLVLQTTHDKFMGIIPRVYTTATQSPLDEPDPTSDLYRFLQAFSFTLDEMLTFADLILPNYADRNVNPKFLPAQFSHYGLTHEPSVSEKFQKKIVRDAIYMYSKKGTPTALGLLVENLTGFAPTISVNKNLMMSPQDSTFYNGLGNWLPYGNCTLTLEKTTVTPTAEAYSADSGYCAKVVTTLAGASIQNGTTNVIQTGIPVSNGGTYTFSYYVKTTTSGTFNVTPTVTWYDYKGNQIGSAVTGTATSATTSWAKQSVTAEAPGFSTSVSMANLTSNVVTLTVPSGHKFSTGNSIVVSTGISPFDGTYSVSATTSTTVSYALTNADVPDTYLAGTVRKNVTAAVYASVSLTFASAGTYYVDLVQFADSSVTSFYDARGAEVLLMPVKSNFLTNPSFENDANGWTIKSGTTVTRPTSTLTTILYPTKMSFEAYTFNCHRWIM